MRPFFFSCLMAVLPVVAQVDEPSMPPEQSLWQTLIMVSIALLFFYFVLWRPERKKRKAQAEQLQSLKKGDRVVAMGIIGHVVRVGDTTVVLRMYDGAKLEFYKTAINDILPPSEEVVCQESSKK